jgi:hypothetical protein
MNNFHPIKIEEWKQLLQANQFLNQYEDLDKIMIYEFLINSGHDSAAKKFFKEARLHQIVSIFFVL